MSNPAKKRQIEDHEENDPFSYPEPAPAPAPASAPAGINDNVLDHRYASKEMLELWSSKTKYTTWRKLWLTLAEGQKLSGLAITDEQIGAMKRTVDDVDIPRAEQIEKDVGHDVMSHIHAWGEQIPVAKGIIHLGATSCFVTDNADLVIMRKALCVVRRQLYDLYSELIAFALKYKDMPTLAMTHLQAAQLTTVGKRAILWASDIQSDLCEIDTLITDLPFRGIRGTTGTQASFYALYDKDADKVNKLQVYVTTAFGFKKTVKVCGQTYSRKIDINVTTVLMNVAVSLTKMATDLRHLIAFKEMDEPFGKNQVGSSAMAYKRNPVKCELVCGLARYVINLARNTVDTAATQWLERTLDDSSNRRLVLGPIFKAADAMVRTMIGVVCGIVVYDKIIARRVQDELPFMATENIIMAGVKAGGDRQELHEIIRVLSQEAARRVKEEGLASNPLMNLMREHAVLGKLFDSGAIPDHVMDPMEYVGMAPQQVDAFVASSHTFDFVLCIRTDDENNN